MTAYFAVVDLGHSNASSDGAVIDNGDETLREKCQRRPDKRCFGKGEDECYTLKFEIRGHDGREVFMSRGCADCSVVFVSEYQEYRC